MFIFWLQAEYIDDASVDDALKEEAQQIISDAGAAVPLSQRERVAAEEKADDITATADEDDMPL